MGNEPQTFDPSKGRDFEHDAKAVVLKPEEIKEVADNKGKKDLPKSPAEIAAEKAAN